MNMLNGPQGIFGVTVVGRDKVRALYPHAAIIRPADRGYKVFGTVEDAREVKMK